MELGSIFMDKSNTMILKKKSFNNYKSILKMGTFKSIENSGQTKNYSSFYKETDISLKKLMIASKVTNNSEFNI